MARSAPRPQPIEIELAGASLQLRGDNAELLEYARVHLAPLGRSTAAEPAIESELRWHEGAPPERAARHPQLGGMERLDRDLYRGEGQLLWFRIDELPDLHLQFHWDGRRLRVEGDYYHRLSKRASSDRLKRLVYRSRVPQLRQRRFTTLLYYLVYYPCFWWLERQRDLHPIHAAGVELDGRVVLLAGPSGVGKSTLSTGLAALPGARLLSDTFILHKGTTARPVCEPLLLDRFSREWIGAGAERLQPIDWRYCLGRDGFHWPREHQSGGGEVKLLLFPHRAARPGLRRVEPQAAHARISSGDFIINDLRRYWAFAAVLEMLDPTLLVAARERNLAELTAAVPCHEIGLTREVGREALAAQVRQLAAASG